METHKNRKVKCPSCGGDGIETCDNPDHGFLAGVGGLMGANESACPCCGHDPNYKIRKYKDGKWINNPCEHCNGTGIMDEDIAIQVADELNKDNELEYI